MAESPRDQCLFCLEESTPENTVVEITYQLYYTIQTCTCRITTHTGCYIHYLVHKGHSECPICHRVYESPEPSAPAIVSYQQQQQQQQQYIIVDNMVYRRAEPSPINIVVTRNESTQICRQQTRLTVSCIVMIIFLILVFLHI
jgi:hypothetical protein